MAYAWRSRRLEIVVTLVAVVVLIFGVLYFRALQVPAGGFNSPNSTAPPDWTSWLSNAQAMMGVFTLLVAVAVWLGELREDWEQDIPCRMSVYFFHAGQPLIVCRYVWLAGVDDLRAWGQQVGAQAAEEGRLDFSPDLVARTPNIAVAPNGSICRHYCLRFQLTRIPTKLAAKTGVCRYQNLLAADIAVRDVALKEVQSLPDVCAWRGGSAA